jgi:hypothetical protein
MKERGFIELARINTISFMDKCNVNSVTFGSATDAVLEFLIWVKDHKKKVCIRQACCKFSYLAAGLSDTVRVTRASGCSSQAFAYHRGTRLYCNGGYYGLQ